MSAKPRSASPLHINGHAAIRSASPKVAGPSSARAASPRVTSSTEAAKETSITSASPRVRPASALGERDKLTLDRVVGTTATTRAAFTSHPVTGDLAYPAGSMIVIYNARRHRQTRFFSNTTNRAFSCIAFSHDGRYLLAGEIGMGARVLVFDYNSEQIRPCAVLACSVAKIGGISCVSISRCCKYIAACLDTSLCVWSFAPSDTPLTMVADAKLSEKITSISFAPSSVSGTPGAACVFVTTGNKSLRFWSFDPVGTKVRSTAGSSAASPLSCTLAQLGDFANDAFVDCVFDTAMTGSTEGNVYALTASGKLVCVDSRHVVEKWVDLRMPNATALSLSGDKLAIAGGDGLCRVFASDSFRHLCSLPRPAPLGQANAGLPLAAYNPKLHYADTIAICFSVGEVDPKSPATVSSPVTLSGIPLVACLYSDRSFFIYDATNIKSIGKFRSCLHHSSGITDIAMLPATNSTLPSSAFLTCGEDRTLRVWALDNEDERFRNVYSRDLIHTVHVEDPEFASIKRRDFSNGLHAVAVNGDMCATGDSLGNIRIHSLKADSLLSTTHTLSAHKKTINALSFGSNMLAAASEDHTLSVHAISNNEFKPIPVEHSHSGTVTNVSFACNGTRLLSAGADRQIVFRTVHNTEITKLNATTVGEGSAAVSIKVHPTQKFAVSCGAEKQMQIWTLTNGRPSRTYKLAPEGMDPSRLCVDPAGLYAVTCSDQDHSIRLYDWLSGKMLACVRGHAEPVTGVSFSNDGKRLYTVSQDGCIFVWNTSPSIAASIKARLTEMTIMAAQSVVTPPGVVTSPHVVSSTPTSAPIVSPTKPKAIDAAAAVSAAVIANDKLLSKSDPASKKEATKTDVKVEPVKEVAKDTKTDVVKPVETIKPTAVVKPEVVSKFTDSNKKLVPALAEIPSWARSHDGPIEKESHPVVPTLPINAAAANSINSAKTNTERPLSARDSRWAQRVDVPLFADRKDDMLLQSLTEEDLRATMEMQPGALKQHSELPKDGQGKKVDTKLDLTSHVAALLPSLDTLYVDDIETEHADDEQIQASFAISPTLPAMSPMHHQLDTNLELEGTMYYNGDDHEELLPASATSVLVDNKLSIKRVPDADADLSKKTEQPATKTETGKTEPKELEKPKADEKSKIEEKPKVEQKPALVNNTKTSVPENKPSDKINDKPAKVAPKPVEPKLESKNEPKVDAPKIVEQKPAEASTVETKHVESVEKSHASESKSLAASMKETTQKVESLRTHLHDIGVLGSNHAQTTDNNKKPVAEAEFTEAVGSVSDSLDATLTLLTDLSATHALTQPMRLRLSTVHARLGSLLQLDSEKEQPISAAQLNNTVADAVARAMEAFTLKFEASLVSGLATMESRLASNLSQRAIDAESTQAAQIVEDDGAVVLHDTKELISDDEL